MAIFKKFQSVDFYFSHFCSQMSHYFYTGKFSKMKYKFLSLILLLTPPPQWELLVKK